MHVIFIGICILVLETMWGVCLGNCLWISNTNCQHLCVYSYLCVLDIMNSFLPASLCPDEGFMPLHVGFLNLSV